MPLYSVHFTEKKIVSVYATSGRDKGKKIKEYTENIPRTLHALPWSTAMQYKPCDNFRYEEYVPTSSERMSGQPNYRARQERKSEGLRMAHTTVPVNRKTTTVKPSGASNAIKNAAITGDMSAAINAGA